MPTPADVDGVPLGEVLDLLTERIARYRVTDLRVLFCNAAWAHANGARPEELIGRTMEEVLSPAELDGLRRQIARLGPTTPFLKDNVLRSLDRWIEWTDLYLPGAHGPEVLAVGRDVTERQEAERQLAASEMLYRDLALRDALTGLANRRLLDELLTRALARTRRYGHCLVVSYLDLDGFKQINDQHGHHVGDAVLHEVARRLERGLRDVDVIARVGGDEFVVVQECPAEQARGLPARLARILAPPIAVGDLTVRCAASTGSVVSRPTHDASALIAAADAAMYAVKRGRSEGRRPGPHPAPAHRLPTPTRRPAG